MRVLMVTEIGRRGDAFWTRSWSRISDGSLPSSGSSAGAERGWFGGRTRDGDLFPGWPSQAACFTFKTVDLNLRCKCLLVVHCQERSAQTLPDGLRLPPERHQSFGLFPTGQCKRASIWYLGSPPDFGHSANGLSKASESLIIYDLKTARQVKVLDHMSA